MTRPVIFYIYDVLCGWCYGFSPVIQAFWQKHQEEYTFKVLSGGMITDRKEGPIGEVAPYIKKAYREVEQTTGVQFGENFLQGTLAKADAFFSSLPGALAMAVFRYLQPDQVIPFAAAMQNAIYREGKLPAKPETYGACAEEFGMDAPGFMKRMVEKELLETVQNEFKLVQEWGVQGFPTVIYIQDEQAYLLARGYTPLAQLEENLQTIKAKSHA